jgi:hypothetical protein
MTIRSAYCLRGFLNTVQKEEACRRHIGISIFGIGPQTQTGQGLEHWKEEWRILQDNMPLL